MANPQPEPFLKFSKELFDALLLSPMPGTHKEVVLAVIRRTYGDHGKKEAPISLSLLAAMTGRNRVNVSRVARALVGEGVLRLVRPASFTQPAIYGINKDYETWGKWSVPVSPQATVADTQQGADTQYNSEPTGNSTVSPQATIEDLEILEDFLTGGDSPPPSEEEDTLTPQTVVAFAVDRAREHGVDLTDGVKGHLAREVGKQFKAGADPLLVRAAVGELIERNKDPSTLSYVMRDLKGGGRVGAHSGRSQNGEW